MSNDTIFREVDEELRGDRLRAVWRRIGPFVIGGAIAIVLVVAVNEGWTWWQNSNAARSSDQFYAALELAEAGDVEAAQAALNDVVAQGTGGYPALARFRQASLLAADGKTAEAVSAYDAIATAETNARLREMALVLAAYLLVDGGDVAAVQQRVGGLTSPQSALRNPAREAIGLTQYKAGDLEAAIATFTEILADPQVGQELRGRVEIFVAQLRSMGAGAAPETAASDAAAGTDQPAATEAPPVADGAAEEASPADEAATAAPAAEPPVETVDPPPAAEPAAEEAPPTPSVGY